MRHRLSQLVAALAGGLTVWILSTAVAAPAPISLSGGDSAIVAVTVGETALPTATAPPTATAQPSSTPALPAVAASQVLVEPTDIATATPTAVYQPTPDAAVGTRDLVLPILTYHYVEPWPADASPLREGLTVRPEDFQAQMDYLATNGYTTVSLYDLVDALATGKPLPDKPVILTFDDGYSGLFSYAVPIMATRRQTGAVFVITELVDQGRSEYLTWSQLRFMHDLGWSVEPHTKSHIGLEGLSYERQLYEMLGSIETVEANLGVRPRFFNYPSGSYDATTLKLAPELGLWGAVTTQGGWYHRYADRYTLTRLRVTGNTDLPHFIDLLGQGR